jgi:hypothetical protein
VAEAISLPDAFYPLTLLTIAARLGLSERRQLYDLGYLFSVAGLGALAIDTMAGYRQSPVKIVDLVAVQADRLLTAPAEPFRPRRMPEYHTFSCARVVFDHDLDSFIFTRGIKNL